ncbi:MAG: hypothetical protein IS860_11535, partial [Nitrosopumilus sp.]|nr:hypothetical protein [Nitrosopumilus sp.]
EFVDDGRVIPIAKLQGTAPPWIMHDIIMGYQYNPSNIEYGTSNDAKSIASINIASIPHEKYSINPGKGFYIEDWMPSYIPEGYKLLYIDNACDNLYHEGACYVRFNFVPKDFEYHERMTNWHIQNSQGFRVTVSHIPEGRDQVEDKLEEIIELFSSQRGYYGNSRDMTHNGKPVLAFEGGSLLNNYRAVLSINLDEHLGYAVTSNYHTLDELIPIFKSIMK